MELEVKEVKEPEVKEKKKKVNQKSVRFSKAKWYKPGTPVIVAGLGGIGSWLSFFLARQECELHIFDMDTIEELNLGGQLYSMDNIGSTKEEGVQELCKAFSGSTNIYNYGEYKQDSIRDKYMFSAFDNLSARKLMFKNWEAVKGEDKIFIDGRMSLTTFDVFFVTPDRAKQYKEDLYSDIKIDPLNCNLKATSHCGAMCAGMMVSGFNNYMANVGYGTQVHELPFKISTKLDMFEFEIT